jgi:hypothetical protein
LATTLTIRFYEELNDFLSRELRKRDISHKINATSTVKDVIESFGVPHTEVDLILINGVSVGFGHIPLDGDRISVYPVFESFDVSNVTRLRPEPLRFPRFILDVHLGKLARKLRMIGFDAIYRNDLNDPEIISIASAEKRIILTRDIGILKHGAVAHGYFIRSQNIDKQIREVIHRFDLAGSMKPWTRCIVCNGSIEPANKQKIEHLLKPKTRKFFNVFYKCSGCSKIYWEGSHFKRIKDQIARIAEESAHGSSCEK